MTAVTMRIEWEFSEVFHPKGSYIRKHAFSSEPVTYRLGEGGRGECAESLVIPSSQSQQIHHVLLDLTFQNYRPFWPIVGASRITMFMVPYSSYRYSIIYYHIPQTYLLMILVTIYRPTDAEALLAGRVRVQLLTSRPVSGTFLQFWFEGADLPPVQRSQYEYYRPFVDVHI